MKQTIKLTESELKNMIKEAITNASQDQQLAKDPTYINNFFTIIGKFYERMKGMQGTIQLLHSYGKNFLGRKKSTEIFYNPLISYLIQMEKATDELYDEVYLSVSDDDDNDNEHYDDDGYATKYVDYGDYDYA